MSQVTSNSFERAAPLSSNDGTLPVEEQMLVASMETTALRDYALGLLSERQATRKFKRAARDQLKRMREEIDSITCPEHLIGTLTAVEQSPDGQPIVEVCVSATRLRVGVHPNVPKRSLRVGTTVAVAKARNCILGTIAGPPPFRDVGTLEQLLGESLLIKHQEHLLHLRPSDELQQAEDLQPGDRIGFDRESGIAFVRLASPDRQRYFETEYPRDSFAELGGMDTVIATIRRQFEFRLAHATIADSYRLKSKNILLVGPPGGGKTKLARCCAALVGELSGGKPAQFMFVAGSAPFNKYFGESEANVRARFAAAREAAKNGPVLIYFDEIDALARVRGGDHGSTAPDRVLNTLLSELDGLLPTFGIVVMASTNRPDVLDPAVTRSGRFDLKITVGPPNRAGARAILAKYLARLPLEDSSLPLDQTD